MYITTIIDLPPTSPISGYFHSHNDEQRILDVDEPEASGQATRVKRQRYRADNKWKNAYNTTAIITTSSTSKAGIADRANRGATGSEKSSTKVQTIKSKTKKVIFKAKTASFRRLRMSNNTGGGGGVVNSVGKSAGGGLTGIGNISGASASNTNTQHLSTRNYFSLTRQPSQKPRASYPEIMQPRLSLNGTLRHLVPSPRPLYRDHSSRSIQPLTANEQQMAELDGSFYGNTLGCFITGGSKGGGSGGGVGGSNRMSCGGTATGGSGGGGESNTAFHTTELSITPTLTCDEQYIDLGSLRRFSIDRQSFLGKRCIHIGVLCISSG